MLLIFILGGLITPPDIFSQIFIAIPFLIIYEFILFFYLLLINYEKVDAH